MKLTKNNILFYDPSILGLDSAFYFDAGGVGYNVPSGAEPPKFNSMTGEKFEAYLSCPEEKFNDLLKVIGDEIEFDDLEDKLKELSK